MNENEPVFEFDKFIENIVRNEENRQTREVPEQEKTGSRRYIEKYRELPQNRTRYDR